MILTQRERFKEIADSIRLKTGETGKIKPVDFAEKIAGIYTDAGNWDSVQANGYRRDYSYAFANTAYKTLNPSYDIICEKCVYMFMNAQEITSLSNIVINIISSNPNMSYLCMGCINLINAPVMEFDYSAATAVRTWVSAFANCVSLENVGIYLGTGQQNPVSVRNNMANCFFKCKKIKNLTFSGVGSPINLDLSYIEDISTESLESLSGCLMDVSGADSGVYEIIINNDQQSKLSENRADGITLYDIMTQKGWSFVIKEREDANEE